MTFMHILTENKIIFITKEKQEYTEINAKFLATHFTSNQILILYKSYQWLKFRASFSHLLHAVPTHSALFEEWNAFFSIKNSKNTCHLGDVAF